MATSLLVSNCNVYFVVLLFATRLGFTLALDLLQPQIEQESLPISALSQVAWIAKLTSRSVAGCHRSAKDAACNDSLPQRLIRCLLGVACIENLGTSNAFPPFEILLVPTIWVGGAGSAGRLRLGFAPNCPRI